MRPIRLVMQAFGPYAGRQVVDFRRLEERTFFLITGPTGSGKTTILDAICYGLYGDTSGLERGGREMCSDHSPPEVLSEVVFDFALGPERYRVHRCPEQQRPAKRGEGLVTQRPVATLWHRTGLSDDAEEGKVLAAKWGEVTRQVETLLGFRSEQFRQVVLLPQGQFRRLLVADSRQRQEILEALFRTELYRRIAEALKAAAREIEGGIRQVRERRAHVLGDAEVESEEQLTQRRDGVAAQRDRTRAALKGFRGKQKQAEKALTAGRQAREKFIERDGAAKALAALTAQRESIAQKEARLGLARKAAGLRDVEAATQQRKREANDAQRKCTDARDALGQAKTQHQQATARLKAEEKRGPEREQTEKQHRDLEGLRGKVGKLAEARKLLAAATVKVESLGKKRSDADERWKQLHKEIAASQKMLEGKSALSAQVEARQLAAAGAERKHKARKLLAAAAKKLTASKKKHDQAAGHLKKLEADRRSAQAHLAEIETAWLEGQAAVLAKGLEPGRPCPVCGSKDHPRPAEAHRELPDGKTVRQEREKLQDLEGRLGQARQAERDEHSALTELAAEAKARKEALGDQAARSVSALARAERDSQTRLAEARKAQREAAALTEQVEALRAKEAEAQESLKTLEADHQQAVRQQDGQRAVVAEREAGLPEHLREAEALEKTLAETAAKLEAMRRALKSAEAASAEAAKAVAAGQAAAKAAEEAANSASKRAAAQEKDLAQRLEEAGFATARDYAAAKMIDEQADALQNEIKAFHEGLKAAEDRRRRAEEAVEGLAPPDLAALTAAAEQAQAAVEQAARAETDLIRRLQQFEKWLKALAECRKELAALDEQYATVGRISEVANGTNVLGITFERFVLASLLDDVLVAASKRLGIMSKGRFYLQRQRTRADRRMAAGLDLETYDFYTGTTRPVANLSGGESFLASLSLALGLADIVQAYSGGLRLETIFVDEGFGSLDPESLDLAVRALIDLQSSGRLVGIISHVPDLKERIDTRLEVTTDKRGSTAEFVVA